MTRWIASLVGLTLIAIAFIAAAQVADTREGLIAEVVTLFAGLAGVLALLYGLVPKRPAAASMPDQRASTPKPHAPRSANDLLMGSTGLVLAAVLLTGLVISGGWGWAFIGGLLLLPMIAGCVYLCAAFASAEQKDWTINLRRLIGRP